MTMHPFVAAALLGLASAVPFRPSSVAADADTTTHANSASSTTEPCAQVGSILSSSAEAQIPAALALDCLRSVPLDKANDTTQLEGVKAFVGWESTLAYLKDPPPGYLYPSVDILGALDQIGDRLQSDQYTNEYDFQMDILNVTSSAKSGHFYYYPDIASVFSFVRGNSLLSVSSDGKALPDVYLNTDIEPLANPKQADYTPSPITSINGQDVETYLNQLAFTGENQDPDANYNSVMYNIPVNSYSAGSRRGLFMSNVWGSYQGNDTTVKFANGTTVQIPTYATTKASFAGVKDGASFFQRFCTGELSAAAGSSSQPSSTVSFSQVPYSAVPTQTSIPAPVNYPAKDLVVIASDSSIAGYFPSAHSDLAVLSVPTFEPAYNAEFQNVVREFLATAHKAGKTKLQIDLRGNGGGIVMLGYDMFKQLFPSMTPYGATNFRATGIFNDTGSIATNFYANISDEAAAAKFKDTSDLSNPMNVRNDLNSDNGNFGSWSDFFGPNSVHNDNFTSLSRYNLSDPYSTGGGVNVTGYAPGNMTNINPIQTFDPENIVLIQDGGCASTCTVFSEFMKTQANVSQVVFGGRKQNGPMQGVGSVRGANVYPFTAIWGFLDEVYQQDAAPHDLEYLQETYPNLPAQMQQALLRATSAAVNARNNIRQGDESLTPLQFVYEAADCRLFYTPPMLLDQGLVWNAAYDAHWGNATCVANSTGQASSAVGAVTSYIGQAPPQGANNTFGAQISFDGLVGGSGWTSLYSS